MLFLSWVIGTFYPKQLWKRQLWKTKQSLMNLNRPAKPSSNAIATRYRIWANACAPCQPITWRESRWTNRFWKPLPSLIAFKINAVRLNAITNSSANCCARATQKSFLLRDRIIEQGIDAIEALVAEIERADRQKLRQLWRNHQHAKTDAKRIQSSRLIYKEIKQSIDS
jgi:hypothetical protein